MKTVIFACVHNAGRSQMAKAFFNLYSKGAYQAISAGTAPAEKIHPEVSQVMSEIGIDLSEAKPTLLSKDLAESASLLVTMGCGENCPYVPGFKVIDWKLEDPKGKGVEHVRAIRDEIKALVLNLLATMIPQTELTTTRFLIRPFKISDAKQVQKLAGHPQIAATTANIPHPYPDGAAEAWINQHAGWFVSGTNAQMALTLRETGELVGCISLFGISQMHRKAEMGYWIAVDHWGKGYCSEAGAAMLQWGFEELALNRVIAQHMAFNTASGKVMQKIGMKKEGTHRQDSFKNGVFHDLEYYAILRDEWLAKFSTNKDS